MVQSITKNLIINLQQSADCGINAYGSNAPEPTFCGLLCVNFMYKNKKCPKCKIIFLPTSSNQIFCGSYKKKTGCSYKHKLEKVRNSKYGIYYNISTMEYEKLLKKQFNKCIICQLKKKLCVDHCHKTGKVRGLLCMQCNVALGLLKDNIRLLKRSLEYLSSDAPLCL